MSGSVFKAILWKELRENLKWGVVVLVGMAAVLAFATRSTQGNSMILYEITSMIAGTTIVGAILAGLLIGAAQTFVESRGDKWGFLAHRPVSRTTLFWGKATAGILLYALSTVLPVAAVLSWIATPGYLPVPFDWRISLPAIANLLCGLVFYFAGLLTGIREARWFASRALGIGAAIWCLVLQMDVPDIWQAAAISVAGLIVVGTAAWSTFVAGGQYGIQPRIGRAATGLSIGLGLLLAGCVVYAVLAFQLDLFGTSRGTVYSNYTVTPEGKIVLTSVANGQVEVTDLNGRPVDRDQTLSRGQNQGPTVLSASLLPRSQAVPSFRSTDRLFTQLRRYNVTNQLSWYYVHRLDLIAAYDNQSRKLVGWIGPDGFSPGDAKPRSFAGPLKNRLRLSASGSPHLLVLKDAVYRLDLESRRVEKIFQPEPGETLLDAGTQQYDAPALASSREMVLFDAIATTRRVIVQRRDGTRILEVPQDAKAMRYSSLQVLRAMRNPEVPTFLWYQGMAGGESQISEFNSSGSVVNSWTLPPTIREQQKPALRIAISSAITPPIGEAFIWIAGRTQQADSSSSRSAWNTNWTVALLSSLLSAAAVFLRGRKYAFPPGRLSTWAGIALVLGPLGYLMMLALIEWPAHESCPACSRKRVVTRQHCEHCREPFAAPPPDGTEIFDPAR